MSQDDPADDPFARREPERTPTWPSESAGYLSTSPDQPQWGPPPGSQGGPGQGGPGQGGPGQAPPGWQGGPAYGGPSYDGQGYGAPGQGQHPGQVGPAGQESRNGLAVAGLVLGIVSILFSWTILLGVVGGVLAVIFGAVGRARVRKGEASNGGVALASLSTGVIGALIGIVVAAFAAVLVASHTDDFSGYADCVDQATSSSEQDACGQSLFDNLTGG